MKHATSPPQRFATGSQCLECGCGNTLKQKGDQQIPTASALCGYVIDIGFLHLLKDLGSPNR